MRKCSVIPKLSAVLLLLQAVISVHTELVAVPVTVTHGRPQPTAVVHHGEAPVAEFS